MLHVKVIAVGRLKERYLHEGCQEYLRRLGAYARVEVTELKEEAGGPASARIAEEAKRIAALLPANGYAIALDEGGRQMSSVDLANLLTDVANQGVNDVCFIIGSADGLAPMIRQKADLVLSFSRFTFPHQLFRLMLLEQIYRAFTIQRGEPYHRARIPRFDGSSDS